MFDDHYLSIFLHYNLYDPSGPFTVWVYPRPFTMWRSYWEKHVYVNLYVLFYLVKMLHRQVANLAHVCALMDRHNEDVRIYNSSLPIAIRVLDDLPLDMKMKVLSFNPKPSTPKYF